MIKQFLWERKHSPSNLSECIIRKSNRTTFNSIIESGRVPSMTLFSHKPGSGKTAFAKALCKQMKCRYIFVNGSDCKIDYIREELPRFVSARYDSEVYPGGMVVIIDEFDRAPLREAQQHLRSYMEAIAGRCSFIITANDLRHIIEPLQSRAPVYDFLCESDDEILDFVKQMTRRCASILKSEGHKPSKEEVQCLFKLARTVYPDFRSMVKQTQIEFNKNGAITNAICEITPNSSNSLDAVVAAFKKRSMKELMRITGDFESEYDILIRHLYDRVYPQVSTSEGRIAFMTTIAESQKHFKNVVYPKLHIDDMFLTLLRDKRIELV